MTDHTEQDESPGVLWHTELPDGSYVIGTAPTAENIEEVIADHTEPYRRNRTVGRGRR